MMNGIDMKANCVLMVGLCALVLSGCARENKAEASLEGKDLTFTACWEGGDTRTLLLADGTSVWWTTDESVNIFYGNRYEGKFTSTNTASGALAQFCGTLTAMTGTVETMADDANAYWAVYPYNDSNTCDGSHVVLTVPEEQETVPGTFADHFFPSVAKSSGLNLAFYHVCGGIRFSVVSEGIKSVTVKGNGGESLAGKVTVAFDANGHPVVTSVLEGKKEVTVHAPGNGTFEVGKYYFITLLPQTLQQGFTMSYTNASLTRSASKTSAVTVNRSRFGVVDGMDEGLFDTHEAVDLGLSVLWASFNIGSDSPEEAGYYFSWGETSSKPDYSWEYYKWCSGTSTTLTKYCVSSNSGTVDDKKRLEQEDDAAHVHWGGTWRIPTRQEIKELCENCSWSYQENNRGYTVTSKINGNQIFLPFSDSFAEWSPVPGRCGLYWTSEIGDSSISSTSAFALYIESTSYRYDDTQPRYRGLTIRAVKEKK